MPEPPEMSMREALAGVVPLRRLSAAQFVSTFGDFVAIFAVFSVVSFRLHGDAIQATGIMIAYMLPQAFVGPLAGVFIDRWHVKTAMIVSDLLRGALVVCLVYSTSIWQFYGVMIMLSGISAFFLPAQTIALRALVPMNGLLAANALMMQVMQIAQIIAPGFAGLMISRTGAAVCFWLDSASFLFSAAVVSTIVVPRAAVSVVKDMPRVLADLTFGARYIFTHGLLAFSIFSLAAGGFAVSCYSALIVLYARDVLHGSAQLFGLLGTLVALGMISGTQGITRYGRTLAKERLIIFGLLGMSLAISLLAVFDADPQALVAALGVGIGAAVVIIPAQTLMQLSTPMEMMGRVSGSLRSVLAMVQIAGLVLSGSIAQGMGIRPSFFALSGLLALIAFAGLRLESVRKATAFADQELQSFSRSTRR